MGQSVGLRNGCMGGFEEWVHVSSFSYDMHVSSSSCDMHVSSSSLLGGWVGLRNGCMGLFKEWVDGWVANVDDGFGVDLILSRGAYRFRILEFHVCINTVKGGLCMPMKLMKHFFFVTM